MLLNKSRLVVGTSKYSQSHGVTHYSERNQIILGMKL